MCEQQPKPVTGELRDLQNRRQSANDEVAGVYTFAELATDAIDFASRLAAELAALKAPVGDEAVEECAKIVELRADDRDADARAARSISQSTDNEFGKKCMEENAQREELNAQKLRKIAADLRARFRQLTDALAAETARAEDAEAKAVLRRSLVRRARNVLEFRMMGGEVTEECPHLKPGNTCPVDGKECDRQGAGSSFCCERRDEATIAAGEAAAEREHEAAAQVGGEEGETDGSPENDL